MMFCSKVIKFNNYILNNEEYSADMEKKMYKISIIIPIYNVENYLERSLESIKNQTFKNWECIMINDGSTDNSVNICEKYLKEDKRFTLLHQKNSGSGVARAKGLNKSTGDYICFIDPDDYISLDALGNNIKIAKEYNPDIIANGYYELKKKYIREMSPKINGFFVQEEFRKKFKLYSQVGVSSLWNKLYKRDFLLANKLTFTAQRTGQDAVFNYNVYKYVNSIYVDNKSYYYYDMTRDGSAVNSFNENRFENEKNITKAFEDAISHWNMTKHYNNEIKRRKWTIFYNEIVNINLPNNPYSFRDKLKILEKLRTNNLYQTFKGEMIFPQNFSRISQIVFFLFNNKMYYILLLVINLYLKLEK